MAACDTPPLRRQQTHRAKTTKRTLELGALKNRLEHGENSWSNTSRRALMFFSPVQSHGTHDNPTAIGKSRAGKHVRKTHHPFLFDAELCRNSWVWLKNWSVGSLITIEVFKEFWPTSNFRIHFPPLKKSRKFYLQKQPTLIKWWQIINEQTARNSTAQKIMSCWSSDRKWTQRSHITLRLWARAHSPQCTIATQTQKT